MKRILFITILFLTAILLAARLHPSKAGIEVATEPQAYMTHSLLQAHASEEKLPLIPDSELTPENTDRILEAAAEWAKFSPEQTASWAQKIGSTELREQTLAAIATTWADENPIAAAHLLLLNTQPSQLQHNTAIGILQRLARKDTAAAEQWASQFPQDLQETARIQLLRIHDRLEFPSSPLQ